MQWLDGLPLNNSLFQNWVATLTAFKMLSEHKSAICPQHDSYCTYVDVSVGEPDLLLVCVDDALDLLNGLVRQIQLRADGLKNHNTYAAYIVVYLRGFAVNRKLNAVFKIIQGALRELSQSHQLFSAQNSS